MPVQTETVFSKLKSDINGLSQKEAANRLEKFGKNLIVEKHKKNWFIEFLKEFTDIMVITLLCASLIAVFFGEEADGLVILIVVLLNAVIGFIQKFKAEKAIEALKKMVTKESRVLRDGHILKIESQNLVPGDIILFEEGDIIPADGEIIENANLQIIESVITGESMPVSKFIYNLKEKPSSGMGSLHRIFLGTQVASGNGKAIVIATGMETEFGKIAHLTDTTKKDSSPLQKEMKKIGGFVGKITILVSFFLILIGIFLLKNDFISSLLFAVSVAVAAVPEGLPATITISLALSAQRLAKKKAILKSLASAETLGGTTVICSDKTGTITQNKMIVKNLLTLSEQIEIEKNKISFKGGKNNFKKIAQAAILANNANYTEKKILYGDPTETAILSFFEKISEFNPKKIRQKIERIQEFPFDSFRKCMSTIDKIKNHCYLHLKGAPEIVLEKCSHVLKNGEEIPINQTIKKIIGTYNQIFSRQAMRVLAIAYKKTSLKKNYKQEEEEKNLIFLGLIAMYDPPRPEVKKAIRMTKEAGIKTYMITGDFSLTAAAIAENIGLIDKVDISNIILGDILEKMPLEKLKKMLKDKSKDYLFVRVSPAHKLKIVTALKENGEIVAVTGDGVNDAPALKKADIGISMGITGTEVSKEAANMVLTDDSFATIVQAVKEGRNIYQNLKKFLYYIFSCNIGELVTIFAAIILNILPPLTAILILAVNLGTDVLPALALNYDPYEEKIMKKAPRAPNKRILSKKFIINFGLSGIFIGSIVFLGYLFILDKKNYLEATSFAFALLVAIQMFQAFNCRNIKESIFNRNFLTNPFLFGAIGLSMIFVILVIELPFFQTYLKTSSLGLMEWGLVVILASSVLIFEEIKKFFLRKFNYEL